MGLEATSILIQERGKNIHTTSRKNVVKKKESLKNMNLIDLYANPPVRLRFGEAYELSIIDTGYGAGSNSPYEIMAIKNGNGCELPGITEQGDTVKGWLSKEEVDEIILKMMSISGSEPVNINDGEK
tara:strand:- start:287 stop:667 length:381 start_codon:yes stop_codon:yes gene_type:complete